MTILSILALAIMVIAIAVNIFTDIHPNVFYSAWLVALALLLAGDVAQGPLWGIAIHLALVAIALWGWRGDIRHRRRKAAKA